MRVYVVQWSKDRYRIRRKEVPMRDGEPMFGTAICLRPKWFRTMREALAWINQRQSALADAGRTAG